MAADVQWLCHLADQLVERCVSPAPAHFRGSCVFCTSQLVQKAVHSTMQHFVKPAARVAKAYTMQLFASSLNFNNSSTAFVRSDSLAGPHSSLSQSSSWSRHLGAVAISVSDYLGVAGGAIDSFLESDTSILVLLLWMLGLGIVVTAGRGAVRPFLSVICF